MAENRVIGRDNRLPWRLPNDMHRFKELTVGHTVIMGRRTFESLGRPLSDRRNIVLTRNAAYGPPGVTVAHDLEAAFELAGSDEEVFVIGGEQIYRAALPSADRIYLTVIHTAIEGDRHFPSLDMGEWELVGEEHHPADDQHDYPFTFRRYEPRRTRQ